MTSGVFTFSPELTARAAAYFKRECGADLSVREAGEVLTALSNLFTTFQRPQNARTHSKEVLGSPRRG